MSIQTQHGKMKMIYTDRATPTMYLLIEPRNEPEIIRPLTDNEPLDCDIYAAAYADSLGANLAAPDGYIPDGCGDFRIELLPDPGNRSHVYDAAEYFLELSE